jgi:hypothetical protein
VDLSGTVERADTTVVLADAGAKSPGPAGRRIRCGVEEVLTLMRSMPEIELLD